MNGQDLICLSSSDEDEPQVKRRRITPKAMDVNKSDEKSTDESIICLDSDEETDSNIIFKNQKRSETKEISIPSPCNASTQMNNIENTKEQKVDNSSTPLISSNEKEDLNEEELIDTNKETSSDKSKEIDALKDDTTISSNTDDLLKNLENLPSEAIIFLTACKNQLEGTTSSEPIFRKFPTLIRMFRELSDELTKSDYLKNFVNKQTKIANKSVRGCIVSFKDVYQHLKSCLDSEGVELSKKHWKYVRKLEEVMKKLVEKLNEINETEVDFENDENESPYLKSEIYSQRLCKVYKKYCQILKKNPYAGRITHERLDFVSSHYDEINLAISKKYKNNSIFPSYDELASYIQTIVEEKNLSLSAVELKVESEHCFKKLGNLLQLRRKKELYEAHCSYIIDKEDPAEKDRELETKLRISSKEGKVKIEQVCEEFVKKQDLGMNKEIDSCDSNDDDEESDEMVEKCPLEGDED